MRSFAITFFLFIFSDGFSQSPRYSLVLKTDDRTSAHGISFWQEVRITSKDTSFIYALHSRPGNKLQGLPPSAYTVTLTSLFGQKISKKILLKKNSSLKFSVEKLNKKIGIASLSSRMKEGDTLFILHNASGSLMSNKIGIRRKGNSYFSIEFKGLSDDVLRENEISAEGMELLRQIEKEAPLHNKATGCSIIETYTFSLDGKYFSLNDGTCSWVARARLVKALF